MSPSRLETIRARAAEARAQILAAPEPSAAIELALAHLQTIERLSAPRQTRRRPRSWGMPPAIHGSETSEEAALLIGPKAATLRARVLTYLRRQGVNGATDEEIQASLHMPANTERPRRVELEDAHLIVRTHATRQTRAGRRAHVYTITERGRAWAQKLEVP
jgi:hypothetical protein